MIRKVRERRRLRKAEPSGSVAVLVKAMMFDVLSYITFPLWFPVVVVRGIWDGVGRVFRQAKAEGAAVRRADRRARRLVADTPGE